MELPKLTSKQYEFIRQLGCNGGKLSEAYRIAYDASGMKSESIHKEVNNLVNNPKLAPWVQYIQRQTQKVAIDELNYSIKDCFLELDHLKNLSLETRNTFAVAKGCIELKGKLAGHFKDKQEVEHVGLASLLDKLE